MDRGRRAVAGGPDAEARLGGVGGDRRLGNTRPVTVCVTVIVSVTDIVTDMVPLYVGVIIS